MNSVSFKGMLITPHITAQENYMPPVLKKHYDINPEDTAGNSRTPLSNNGWHKLKKNPSVRELIIWGEDNQLFQIFFKKHEKEIPITSNPEESMGMSSKFRRTALCNAILNLIQPSEVKSLEEVDTFVKDSDNINRNLLTQDILEKALKSLKEQG